MSVDTKSSAVLIILVAAFFFGFGMVVEFVIKEAAVAERSVVIALPEHPRTNFAMSISNGSPCGVKIEGPSGLMVSPDQVAPAAVGPTGAWR